MLRVAVLASGRGSNLAALLESQRAGRLGAEIAVVVSDKGDADALAIARSGGVKAAFVDPAGKTRDAHDAAIVEVLAGERVGLVVLAGYLRLLSPTFLRAFPGRIINVHPSLLPAFAGLDAQRQALEWGVRVTGCTTHFVDEEVDHGPIILQAAVPVEPDDTAETLAARILEREHQVLPATVRLFAEGRLAFDGRRVLVKGARDVVDAGFIAPGGIVA